MIKQLEEELTNCHERATKTAIRGRLIKAIKEEIQKTENPEEKAKLEEKLKEVLKEQRKDLDDRYVNEFLKEKTILGSAFTTLPKGVGISVERVANTIEELKEAKTNKEKIFRAFDLVKSIGQTALTPIVYAGKFAIRHWYALLITLGILDITDTKLFKGAMSLFGKNAENSKILGTIEKIKENAIVSATRNVEHKITGAIGDEIKKRFGNLIGDFKESLLKKLNPFGDGDLLSFFKDNPLSVEQFVKENVGSVQQLSEFLKENPIGDSSEEYAIAKELCGSYENLSLGVQKAI